MPKRREGKKRRSLPNLERSLESPSKKLRPRKERPSKKSRKPRRLLRKLRS